MTRWAPALLGLLAAAPLAGQQPTAPSPTPLPARPTPAVSIRLEEALEQARRNSPTYRQTLNDAGPSRWSVRNAYATLLPSVDVSSSLGYTGSGQSTFGGTFFNQSSSSITSGYGVSFNYTLSGSTLTGPGQQKAAHRAVEEDITSAGETLRNEITIQYLAALQAVAQTDVARQQVQRNGDFLELARARHQVGQATLLDVRQAEVQKGQSDVALLRAQQTENEAKLELFRRIGIPAPVSPAEIALTDSFPVSEPVWDRAQLLGLAAERNPSLRALKAREQSAAWSVRAAKSRYLPTLSFNASLSGFTQEFTDEEILLDNRLGSALGTRDNCLFQNALIGALPGGAVPGFPNGGILDCNAFAGLDVTGTTLDPATRQQLIARNNVFPFDFTKQPFRASVQISLPIFDNFSRNLQLSQAQVAREDLAESVRARGLQVEADVHSRWLGVQTSYQAIRVQELNRVAAREQLSLAQDRYRLGTGSSLEVSDAQNAVQRAEGDYVNAVYEYHRAVAMLEFAVGRPLR
ncbi:MAG: TolC family protein [Gemmatimonadales bacterium]